MENINEPLMSAEEFIKDLSYYVNPDLLTAYANYHTQWHLNNIKEISSAETLGFIDWFTNKKSKYSVMYGNQEHRFADFEKDYTIKLRL